MYERLGGKLGSRMFLEEKKKRKYKVVEDIDSVLLRVMRFVIKVIRYK